jgi:hypothetical protein
MLDCRQVSAYEKEVTTVTIESRAQKPASSAGPYRWPAQGEWTYKEYARLPDIGVRYEVIESELLPDFSLSVASFCNTGPGTPAP